MQIDLRHQRPNPIAADARLLDPTQGPARPCRKVSPSHQRSEQHPGQPSRPGFAQAVCRTFRCSPSHRLASYPASGWCQRGIPQTCCAESPRNPLLFTFNRAESPRKPLPFTFDRAESPCKPLLFTFDRPQSPCKPLLFTFDRAESPCKPPLFTFDRPQSPCKPPLFTFDRPQSLRKPPLFTLDRAESLRKPLPFTLDRAESLRKPLLFTLGKHEFSKNLQQPRNLARSGPKSVLTQPTRRPNGPTDPDHPPVPRSCS